MCSSDLRGRLGTLSGVLEGLSGLALEGYEIHMGRTEVFQGQGAASMAMIAAQTGASQELEADGCCLDNVYGTYVHGIFDAEGIAGALLSCLAQSKGAVFTHAKEQSRREYKETQYDLLADTLRSHLDMEAVYRIMEVQR